MNKQKKKLRRLIRDTILPPCSVSSLSFAEIRRLSSLLTEAITKANAKTPQKVWVLLGDVVDADGSEVIAVFRHNPTKKEQKEALKKYILQAMSDNDEIDLKAEMERYTVAQSGGTYVARSTTQP